MPLILKPRPAAAREITCTQCGKKTEAARRAMSIFCPHCNKRVILENYKIRGYYGVVEFATCGDIVVERTGRVVARIKVNHLTVRGCVEGSVVARGQVVIQKTGFLKGDVQAPSVSIEEGGKLVGYLNVGPP